MAPLELIITITKDIVNLFEKKSMAEINFEHKIDSIPKPDISISKFSIDHHT